jgi:hypothetical protein
MANAVAHQFGWILLEVPSGIEPREVCAPTPQSRVEPRNLLAEGDTRFPPDERSDFVANALHRPALKG